MYEYIGCIKLLCCSDRTLHIVKRAVSARAEAEKSEEAIHSRWCVQFFFLSLM